MKPGQNIALSDEDDGQRRVAGRRFLGRVWFRQKRGTLLELQGLPRLSSILALARQYSTSRRPRSRYALAAAHLTRLVHSRSR